MREKNKTLFHRMMSGSALKLAAPYLRQEQCILKTILHKSNQRYSDVVGIGSGPLIHRDAILHHQVNYIAVDPLLHEYVPVGSERDDIRLYPASFSDITLLRGKFSYIFGFFFNVVAYMEEIYADISKHYRAGDTIFISCWSDNCAAKALRYNYFKHVYSPFSTSSFIARINNNFTINNIHPASFPNYQAHKYYPQQYCDCLVIYL